MLSVGFLRDLGALRGELSVEFWQYINPAFRSLTTFKEIVMKTLKMLATAVLITTLAGCAASVKKESGENSEPYFRTVDRHAAAVTLSLTPPVESKLDANKNFSRDEFLKVVKQTLEVKGILGNANEPSMPSIDVVVTELRSRSTFAAVMFGFLAGNDSITGDVTVRDSAGEPLQRFSISASYALGGFAGGQENARMGWLYQKFADLAVAELTGNVAKDKQAKK